MTLQSELAELEKNPQLLRAYAKKKCQCRGRGILNFVVGKDIITGEDTYDQRTCQCVIKALKRDMKNG